MPSPMMNAAKPITPPMPGENVLAWAMNNPDALGQLIDMHNRMQNLEINVVRDGVTTRAPLFTNPGSGNAIIQLNL